MSELGLVAYRLVFSVQFEGRYSMLCPVPFLWHLSGVLRNEMWINVESWCRFRWLRERALRRIEKDRESARSVEHISRILLKDRQCQS